MNKAELRKMMRRERGTLTVSRILMYSGCITERLMKEPTYRDATLVLAYMSFSSEVSTHFLIKQAWEDGKQVAVPRCGAEGAMEFHRIRSFEDVKEGKYGIPEPVNTEVVNPEKTKAVLLIPCVAFDESGHRLGYGGGYYDRFVEKHPTIPRILLAYELQKVEEVPAESWDIPAEIILTEVARYVATSNKEESYESNDYGKRS